MHTFKINFIDARVKHTLTPNLIGSVGFIWSTGKFWLNPRSISNYYAKLDLWRYPVLIGMFRSESVAELQASMTKIVIISAKNCRNLSKKCQIEKNLY